MHETDVVVIGGGVTGAAVLWDLALRGIPAVLVERDDLGTGTSGRWHGQLHSGGRYAVKDQRSARECVEDNRVLRHIAPHTIEDTGGIMVLLDDHDQSFGDRFVAGCAATGIPCEEIPPAAARRAEPALTDRIARTFRLPTDGGMDSWKLIWSFARGAQELGGRVLTRHPVTGFERGADGQLTAVRLHDRAAGEDRVLGCSWVINAAGAWAGKIGRLAGVPITMIPGKGSMVVMASRYVRAVISHCRMPTDGDIIVPAHEAAILGTTSTQAPDADDVSVDPAEVDVLVDEAARLVPAIADGRVLRAFTGQRPLYQPEATGDAAEAGGSSREVSRTYTVLDHEQRDGVPNLLSIVGGKLTTCRAMAESVVDALVAKRGLDAPSKTATTPLPGAGHGVHQLAHPLGQVEHDVAYGQLTCECELVTRATLERAIDAGVTSLDDLRRQHRFGFGPCQAAFCGWRGAALLSERRAADGTAAIANPPGAGTSAADPLDELRAFMQERWRGQRNAVWGGGAVQALLNHAIYRGVLALHAVEPDPRSRAETDAARPAADPEATAVGGRGALTGDSDGRAATRGGVGDGGRGL